MILYFREGVVVEDGSALRPHMPTPRDTPADG
jgi:hypothetical protein